MDVTEKVSVIIVNFNAGPCLVDAVSSVISEACEVIVVDNASSDQSLEQLQAAFPIQDKLRIMRNAANMGFAKACNAGFLAATGDYLLFLNPDCQMQPGAIRCLVDAISPDPQVAMSGGLLLNLDGSEQAGGRRAVPTPWRSFVRAFGLTRFSKRWPKLFYDFHLHDEPLPASPIEVEAISGACMMVRREAIQEVGLLDENYFMHCEDLDWCMRFRHDKWKVLFVPNARILHHKGVCSRSRPVFVEWHKHKGMIRFYGKHFSHQYPGVLMWLVIGGVWLRFVLAAAFHMTRRIGNSLGFIRD